jgi:hypothetical protein
MKKKKKKKKKKKNHYTIGLPFLLREYLKRYWIINYAKQTYNAISWRVNILPFHTISKLTPAMIGGLSLGRGW